MDNKQKKKLLLNVIKSLMLFALMGLVWIFYFTISNLINNKTNIIWLDITLLILSSLVLWYVFMQISKLKKTNNLYKLGTFLYATMFITLLGVAVGLFLMFYKNYNISFAYKATILLLVFIQVLCVIMFLFSINLIKVLKNTSIYIDSTNEVPNYNDELNMKKKLDELNRKLEMQKVLKQIEEKEKLLDEHN